MSGRFDHWDELPSLIRWVIKMVLNGPIMLVRVAFIGGVVWLWVQHAPQVAWHVYNSLPQTEQPSKRTPRSRSITKTIDFRDVKARISELKQLP